MIASAMDAGVTAESHEFIAKTDSRGRYALSALPPGTYVLTVEHPWLDSTGLSIPARRIGVTHQRTPTVNLAVPSSATIRALFCPQIAHNGSSGLIAGYVKAVRSEHPVSGAMVVFEWSDFDVDARTARSTPATRTMSTNTARDGTFRMCGIPTMRPILMQAQLGERAATGAVEVEVPGSGVLVQTLRLDSTSQVRTTVSGRIRIEGSDRPVAGAHVHLFGASGEVVTTPDGSFLLRSVPLGTQSIEVTAIGFNPHRYALEVRSEDTSPVAIALSETGTALDSIKVFAPKSGGLARNREFDDRSAHGSGQYITEAMIEKTHPRASAELFQQVAGYYVMRDTLYSSRGLTRLEQNSDRVCKPILYVDGIASAQRINDIPPWDIHGIEIYPSAVSVPPQYPAAACGAVFIWMK